MIEDVRGELSTWRPKVAAQSQRECRPLMDDSASGLASLRAEECDRAIVVFARVIRLRMRIQRIPGRRERGGDDCSVPTTDRESRARREHPSRCCSQTGKRINIGKFPARHNRRRYEDAIAAMHPESWVTIESWADALR